MNKIVFACVHNAGRSQMAAAWFNELADPKLAYALSAGTHPEERVHPEVVHAMREVGLNLAAIKPQRLTDVVTQDAVMLITMGCCEEYAMRGAKREDWPFEDPKGKPVTRVRQIRDELQARVAQLIADEGWARCR